ncbi:MAG: hypothetical protein HY906_09530 [Deltaproteobacteria bacterium]|nr:hypothetical protein [Deltaproteobacteria bacterium]
MLEVCARFSACEVPWEPSTFGDDCDGLMQTDVGGRLDRSTETRWMVAFLDCVKLTSDCTGVRACFTASSKQQREVCRDGRSAGCAGEVAVFCPRSDGGQAGAMACDLAGLACNATDAGAGCGLGSCDPGPPGPPWTGTASCQGGLLVACGFDGVLDAMDCAFWSAVTTTGGIPWQNHVGETCETVETGPCVGTGDPCDDASFNNWCDGSVVVTCTAGALAHRDCAALHPALTCRIGDYGIADCAPVAQECDHSAPETCQAGVIAFCSFGVVTTLDCTQYGLSGCATGYSDIRPGTRAYCTP